MSTRTRLVIAACFLITFTTAADCTAQQEEPLPKLTATTPAACAQEANDWRNKQAGAARAELTAGRIDAAKYNSSYLTFMMQAQSQARACAAQFDVERTATKDLPALASLYIFIGDTANARRATERALVATDLSPREQAQALSFAMSQEITRNSQHFGILEGAERYVARLDAMPDSLADIKLAAHQTMLGRYGYLDVADGLRDHALAVIRIARLLNRPDAMVGAYTSLARSASDKLMPDSALKILAYAEKELAGARNATATFNAFRERIGLIGSRAAPIPAEWWINTPETMPATFQPGDGKVTIVEFTAHWCMPCVNSYPGMKALAQRFKDKPFNVVLVTSLYGYLSDQRDLSPEQEVAADRIYYGQKHALPFPVAINRPAVRTAAGQSAGPERIDATYRVGGIPTIYIVDQQGIIRQIVIGWDHGNTERFATYIEQLLSGR